jgi:O-acetyl-ADP-ribose deacetylase (regulator of RNase III)
VAIYGRGFSRFVVLPLPRSVGTTALNSAIQAGADSVALPGTAAGQAATPPAVLIRTPLLTVLMVRAGFHHAVFLFTGAVTPAVLEQSASALVNDLTHFRFHR